MNGDDVARLTSAIVMLVLVASSLAARRLAWGQAIRMALIWATLFSAAYVLFLFRGEAGGIWARVKTDVLGQQASIEGGPLRVAMRNDGHFWVRGSINGRPVDFLVDSGATRTALSEDLARAAELEIDTSFPVPVDTANGTVEANAARIAELRVGPIVQRDARAYVSRAFGDTNVLGMSFLSALKSWKVEGNTLILEP